MTDKFLDLDALADRVHALCASGQRVVHCHGVFDLLHIGHIKHLEAARAEGDALVVTLTPDRYVNKGPHRPAFPEQLRAEAIAALSCVDHVAINRWSTAVETIRLLRSDIYCKGMVQGEGQRDFSDAIHLEREAVESVGGRIHFTDEETWSATNLINRHLCPFTPEVGAFLARLRNRWSVREVVEAFATVWALRVLVVGETILDEYIFCEVLGKTSRDPVLAARKTRIERYAGGAQTVANHLRSFCARVDVLSGTNGVRVQSSPLAVDGVIPGALVKRRYLQEYPPVKLFVVYELEPTPLGQDEAFCAALAEAIPKYDVVLVVDFGLGLMSTRAVELACAGARFLAVHVKNNDENRRFNFVTRYPRADFVTLDTLAARLETRMRDAEPLDLVEALAGCIQSPRLLLKLEKNGCLLRDAEQGVVHAPALHANMVDRVGSGDALLAITAPCVAAGLPLDLVGLLGNIAAAEACLVMGNTRSISHSSFFRHLNSLIG